MRSLVLVKYHFLSLWNWRTSYLGRFIEPLAFLIFLSAGLEGQLVGIDISYQMFTLTGLACLLTFRAATAAINDVANDRKWGVYAIYTLQGGSVTGYVFSIVFFAAIIFLFQYILLILCGGLVFGFSAVMQSWVLSVAAAGFLLTIGWTGIGAAVGARVQSYATRDLVVTVTTLPVVLAAPLFYPIPDGTSLLSVIARVNPLSYQVDWMRSESLTGWILLFAWAIAGYALGWAFMKNAERLSRER